MKKITLLTLLSAVLLLVISSQAFAYPVTSGQEVYLLQSETGATNGDFGVFSTADGLLFNTFCVEEGVYFNPGSKYTATIDDGIKGTKDGGIIETLHGGTKYLYWNFVQGTLTGFSYDSSNVSALQNAFWLLQGDLVDSTNSFYTLAIAHAAEGAAYDVKVMNLWDGTAAKQSQLIANAPVPEPATMVLLGSGLIGLALYRRRMKK
ncbi:MAG: PEP-CTERM sorting domain-containing protein [Desulfuromusa sp.]|nr:PEP-CTERM sorting domain-containing protein [Desulfuromusa sp.]